MFRFLQNALTPLFSWKAAAPAAFRVHRDEMSFFPWAVSDLRGKLLAEFHTEDEALGFVRRAITDKKMGGPYVDATR